MEQARWERLQEIYHQAVALPASERDAFVNNACGDDLELLETVRRMLKTAGLRGGILDSPVIALGSASDTFIGTTIGERYLVESELPHGGMSEVYLARDLRLQRQQVVIKVLSSTLLQNPYAQQKFDQEVEALLRMTHSGVVRVQDKNQLDDGRPYIVMPYVDGVPLSSQITSTGMDLERAASILKQIGTALDHVHENDVFHRDLKPENIMLRHGTDSVVLIDFGIAKVRASLIAQDTVNYALAGTLPYMSPEQLRGESLTRASDIFSMGVVAYQMVTGRLPFHPISPAKLLEMQRAGVRLTPKQLREQLSDKADRAICRALRFDPKTRYERAGEFGDEVSKALRHEPSTPSPIPAWVKVIAGLVIVVAASFTVYKLVEIKSNVVTDGRNTNVSKPSRSFTYFLTVQKMRDGKEYQEPYRSNGEDIFENGDKFQLSVSASEPGYLYIFNEGPTQTNETGFRMMYPRDKASSGSATLGANQTVQSDWINFSGPAGDENVWIVWSVLPVSQLESAKTEASKNSHGELGGDSLVAVKDFLTKQLEFKATVSHYKDSQKATARGRADLLITLAQFKHR